MIGIVSLGNLPVLFSIFSLRSLFQVVGGFCWAISSSGAAVDVDLFYDEELSLGQKMYVVWGIDYLLILLLE